MATAASTVGASSLEDTYRLGDSDAENDDADQVGRDIDEFEARLRGEKAATRTAPARPPSNKVAAMRPAMPVLTKVKPAVGPFSKPSTEEEEEANEARAAVKDLARFDREPESP